MNQLYKRLKEDFADLEYREVYAESFLNSFVATQIQVVREQREMTQTQLAEKIGTKQAGISRIENVNYSAWNIATLKKIAFALGCRLKVSFETFGSLLDEAVAFNDKTLERPSFEKDPVFEEQFAAEETEPKEEGLPIAAKTFDEKFSALEQSVQQSMVAKANENFTLVMKNVAKPRLNSLINFSNEKSNQTTESTIEKQGMRSYLSLSGPQEGSQQQGPQMTASSILPQRPSSQQQSATL